MSFITEFDLSEETAASFAAGMVKIANADGEMHPKEKILIEQFSNGLTINDVVDFSLISEGAATESFMLVTALVAVSDGKVADAEREIGSMATGWTGPCGLASDSSDCAR